MVFFSVLRSIRAETDMVIMFFYSECVYALLVCIVLFSCMHGPATK